jgi:hypothetical protein
LFETAAKGASSVFNKYQSGAEVKAVKSFSFLQPFCFLEKLISHSTLFSISV